MKLALLILQIRSRKIKTVKPCLFQYGGTPVRIPETVFSGIFGHLDRTVHYQEVAGMVIGMNSGYILQ
jgi:hypothetical protein